MDEMMQAGPTGTIYPRPRLLPLNAAEGILLPLFDRGLGRYDQLRFRWNQPRGVRYGPGFEWMDFGWKGRHKGDVLLLVEADLDVRLHGRSRFFLHGSFPKDLSVLVELDIDGRRQRPIEIVTAAAAEAEFEGPVEGDRLTWIRITLGSTADRTGEEKGWLMLAGFADPVERQRLFEPLLGQDWGQAVLDVVPDSAFEPQLGLWFGREDTPAICRRAQSKIYEPLMRELREDARVCMDACCPERMAFADEARALVEKPMYARPHNAKLWHGLIHPARTCALLGLVDRNADMLRYAARAAMAVCTRPTWGTMLDSVPGHTPSNHPGWPAMIMHSMLETLDWAGGAMTARGRQIAWDAVMRNGGGHIMRVMSSQDWLYTHNHGFNGSQLLCLLGVAMANERPGNPHNKWLLPVAERMLAEAMQGCWMDDGATKEGPGYWGGVTAQLAILCVLARHYGISPREYVARNGLPQALLKTGDYLMVMLSNDPDGPAGQYLTQNDSGWGATPAVRPEALAVLAAVTGAKEFRDLHTRRLANVACRFEAVSTGPQMLLMVEPSGNPQPVLSPAMKIMPNEGSLASRRRASFGDVRINLRGWYGGSGGHEHEDKGSIILEVVGRAILIDPGIYMYMDPRVDILKSAAAHNLAVPIGADGLPMRQLHGCRTAMIPQANGDERRLNASVDITAAWGKAAVSAARRIASEDPAELTLTDELTLAEARPVAQYFLSLDPIVAVAGGKAWEVQSPVATVHIEPQWAAAGAVDTQLANHELKTVYRLALTSPSAVSHNLQTTLTLRGPKR